MESEGQEDFYQNEADSKPILDINASIGFNCVGKELIAIHPSDEHFLWATGKTVVIKSV